MLPYIHQLIEDISNAHRPKSLLKETTDYDERLKAVDKWIRGTDAPPTLSQKCGLDIEQFPPCQFLSEEEMRMVMEAFTEMLFSYNLRVDFPENIPVSIAYPLMIGLLHEEAWYLPGGFLCFDFCSGFAPECELREYCHCRKEGEKVRQ